MKLFPYSALLVVSPLLASAQDPSGVAKHQARDAFLPSYKASGGGGKDEFSQYWGDPSEGGKWWAAVYNRDIKGAPLPRQAHDQAWARLKEWCGHGDELERKDNRERHLEMSDNPTGAQAYVCTWAGPQKCNFGELEQFYALLRNSSGNAELHEWSIRVNNWGKAFGVIETGRSIDDWSFACGYPDKIPGEYKPKDKTGNGDQ